MEGVVGGAKNPPPLLTQAKEAVLKPISGPERGVLPY